MVLPDPPLRQTMVITQADLADMWAHPQSCSLNTIQLAYCSLVGSTSGVLKILAAIEAIGLLWELSGLRQDRRGTMERGLLWLPLLIGFGVLAGLGWLEYRKVEAYRIWAQSFDRAKYDLYAMLGWKDTHLVWGKPTRQGPTSMQSADLAEVLEVQLQVDGQRFAARISSDQEMLPDRGRQISLVLLPQQQQIPFSELWMALAWWQRLNQALDQSRATAED